MSRFHRELLGEVLRKLDRIDTWLMKRMITFPEAVEAERRVIAGLITFLGNETTIQNV
jgi:hypothetical protein